MVQSQFPDEDSYRTLLDRLTPEAVFVHDPAGCFVDVNAQACESLGYTRDELLGMNVDRVEQSFSLDEMRAVWAGLDRDAQQLLRGVHRRKDGRLFPVEVCVRVLGGSQQRLYFCSVRDVSEHAHTTASLRAQANQMRSIFQTMAEGLVLQAADGRILDANSAAEAILGLSRDQLLGKTSLDPFWQTVREDGTVFPGDEHPAMVTLRTGRPVSNCIMGIRDPAKGLRWISINTQPVLTEAPTGAPPVAVVATFVDVTAQRRLTYELRRARADMQAILDSIPACITSWSLDHINEFANRLAEQRFSVPTRSMVGRHARDIFGSKCFERAMPYVEAVLSGLPQTFEWQEKEPGGELRYDRIEYVPRHLDGVIVGHYALTTDITELRQSYQRIRDLLHRMERVREEERHGMAQRLHEGLAQDLFGMKLQLTALRSQVGSAAEINGELAALADGIDRCMSSTRQMANDLRPESLSHLGMSSAIAEHARYFARISGLLVDVRVEPGLPPFTEPVQLAYFRAVQEALTNVARHAQATRVQVSLTRSGDEVSLQVADDGVGGRGMTSSQSSGLGLLGLRERFEALGGTVSFEHQEQSGSTLRATLSLKACLALDRGRASS